MELGEPTRALGANLLALPARNKRVRGSVAREEYADLPEEATLRYGRQECTISPDLHLSGDNEIHLASVVASTEDLGSIRQRVLKRNHRHECAEGLWAQSCEEKARFKGFAAQPVEIVD
jgi:hypothetical protein